MAQFVKTKRPKLSLKLCQHCNAMLTNKTYMRHRRLYFNTETREWITTKMLSSKQADSEASFRYMGNICIYSPVGFLVVTIVPLPYLTDSQDEDIVPPKFPTEPEENCEVYSVSEGGEDLDPSEPESDSGML